MHAYSIDRDIRRNVAITIFIISMAVSLVLTQLCSGLVEEFVIFLKSSNVKRLVELLEWLEVSPNFFGIPLWYSVLSWIYDKWIWKCPLLIKWHNIPNLNGKWKGSLTSSYNGETIPMEMDIEQTWSKISFQSTFPKTNSNSYSNVAAIYVEGNNGTEISFAFKNDSYSVADKIQSYNGYNILKLINKNKIKARYFNDRDNPNPDFKGGNKGTFEIERKQN